MEGAGEKRTRREGLRCGKRARSASAADAVTRAVQHLAETIANAHGPSTSDARGLADDDLLDEIDRMLDSSVRQVIALRDAIREADRRNLPWQIWERE